MKLNLTTASLMNLKLQVLNLFHLLSITTGDYWITCYTGDEQFPMIRELRRVDVVSFLLMTPMAVQYHHTTWWPCSGDWLLFPWKSNHLHVVGLMVANVPSVFSDSCM
jgi:hypothetical protein